MQLYSYFRSSAAYRVRIGLNLKSLSSRHLPVDLVAGAQGEDEYRAVNPQGLVPALALQDGQVLQQSMAILEYLEEQFPNPPLLPESPLERARIRALAHFVACDVHPLNNLRVLKYLVGELGVSETQKNTWYQHWINEAFARLEQQLAEAASAFASGDAPGLADCLLIPQIYNARRFKVDMEAYPTLSAIEANCNALEAFEAAKPENQPDAR